jgi:LuxR family maltose regulon positive regulatory protein
VQGFFQDFKLTESLLTTKLFIPRTRPELVHRQRLIERLNGGLHRKLALISAPAGFGKTTLVSEWVENLKNDQDKENQIAKRFAWLSLDDSDNDLVRFLTYFVTALMQVEGLDDDFGKVAASITSTSISRIHLVIPYQRDHPHSRENYPFAR